MNMELTKTMVTSVTGDVWPVTIHNTCETMPDGLSRFTAWNGLKTAGVVLGVLRRYARKNGGPATWHIVPASRNGEVRWHLFVGGDC